jgi:hypothetical protein
MYNMFEYIVIIAAIGSIAAAFVYIRSMFRANTKPNRVTWLMWAIAPLIAFAASTSRNVGWATLPVFMSGFSPLLIFSASFLTKKAYWKLSRFDFACGVLSGFALILWWVTKEPNVAIVFAIASDGLAAVPTLLKSWRHPKTESVWPYIIGTFGAASSYFVIIAWTFSSYAFPTYLIAINLILLIALYNRQLFKRKRQNSTYQVL